MIGVLGASGRIGRLVAAELAERGADAVALTRRDHADLALPARHADLASPATLVPALTGIERLFLVTPHGPEQGRLEANAVRTALAAGVLRIVKISGGAASLGPNGVSATATTHWRIEQLIEASGLGFTFLRTSVHAQPLLETLLATGARMGVLPAPFGRAPIAAIDLRDVARSAVADLLDPSPADRAWHLTGPRAVELADIGARLGVRYVPVAPALARRAMVRQGDDAWHVDHALRMAAYVAAGGDAAVTDHVLRLTGTAARPIDGLVDELRAGFRPATRRARLIASLAPVPGAPRP